MAAACQAKELMIAFAALHLRRHRPLNRAGRDTGHSAQPHGDMVQSKCCVSANLYMEHRARIRLRSPSCRRGRYLEHTSWLHLLADTVATINRSSTALRHPLIIREGCCYASLLTWLHGTLSSRWSKRRCGTRGAQDQNGP